MSRLENDTPSIYIISLPYINIVVLLIFMTSFQIKNNLVIFNTSDITEPEDGEKIRFVNVKEQADTKKLANVETSANAEAFANTKALTDVERETDANRGTDIKKKTNIGRKTLMDIEEKRLADTIKKRLANVEQYIIIYYKY